ncbi:MAG: rod shape-determining protein MreC, partial [bacterium]
LRRLRPVFVFTHGLPVVRHRAAFTPCSTARLKWLEADRWVLDGVPTGADVRIGDLAITTGQGGVFPEGIRTAIVCQLREESAEQFKDVRLRPLADFQTLEEVFILLPEATAPPERAEEQGGR